MDVSLLIIIVALSAVVAVPFLCYSLYKANMRWRCMVYCWQSMSDFAGTHLREEGENESRWIACVKEQQALMAHFKLRPWTGKEINAFKDDLILRLNLSTLEEHETLTL